MFIGSGANKTCKNVFLYLYLAGYVAENGLGTFLEKWGGGPLWDTLGCHAVLDPITYYIIIWGAEPPRYLYNI